MAEPRWVKQYEEFASEVLEENGVPGMSVALARGGRIVYSAGFGIRDHETRESVSPRTLFELASVGKSLAALSIMMLEERGGLSVGDPVTKYLPEFRIGLGGPAHAVTLEHLLGHTSGLPATGALRCASRDSLEEGIVRALQDEGEWESWIEGPDIRNIEDLLSYLAREEVRPLGRPGEYFSYSNDGFALLGAVVELVDGRPFARFVREEIAEPLGMGTTTLAPYPDPDSEVSVGFARIGDGDPIPFRRWEYAPVATAAGFIRSSAEEMMRYGELLLGGGKFRKRRLVSSSRTGRMTSARIPISPETHYGYGLVRRSDYRGVTLVEHGGGGLGVRTNFGVIPELDATIMVMTNAGWAPAGRLWFGLANCLLGVSPTEPRMVRTSVDLDASLLKRWEGYYGTEEGHDLHVKVTEDGPTILSRGDEQKLQPTGPGSALVQMGAECQEVNFINGTTGTVEALFLGHRMVPRIDDRERDTLSMWNRGGF
ncbi:MAG: serine hydrolase domain-containing protein [Bacillota bacterium]